MEFGICIPHYGKVIDVRKIIENVQYAEKIGFDSVWVTDHIIVPTTMDLIWDYAGVKKCNKMLVLWTTSAL